MKKSTILNKLNTNLEEINKNLLKLIEFKEKEERRIKFIEEAEINYNRALLEHSLNYLENSKDITKETITDLNK